MIIRPYEAKDETGWVRCRVLSFLNTAYFDNVLKEKEKYTNESLELVVEENNEIIGIIDLELDSLNSRVCSDGNGLGAMIWHIAIHPDHQRKGIGNLLLKAAEDLLVEKGITRLEAYTRDDKWVNNWYEKNNFINVGTYHHVVFEDGTQMKDIIKSDFPKFYLVTAFAHYLGDDIELIRSKASRVHECNCYSKNLES